MERPSIGSVLSGLAAHIAVIGPSGVILEVNRSWDQFATDHGGNPEKCGVGANYLTTCERSATGGDRLAAVAASGLRDVIRGRRPDFYLEYPCHDATHERWFILRARTITDPDPLIVVSHEDIGRRVRAERERELLQQRARLAEFGAVAANVVDAIGNPMAGILNQAQLIEQRARTGEALERVLAPLPDLMSTARRAWSMLHDFRRFSWSLKLERTCCSLPQLVASGVEEWRGFAKQHDVVLRTELPAEDLCCLGDREQLRPVLASLIQNAVEACDGTGEVSVQCELVTDSEHEEVVRISVADDGCGVPEETDVFRLFASSKAHRSGMDLAIAKEFVLAHGGQIRHLARQPKGTVFQVDLPRATGGDR